MELSWRAALFCVLAVCSSVQAVTDENGVRKIPVSIEVMVLDK